MGEGASLVTDIPRYRVYENGVFTKELTDASAYWKEGYVGFLIGCSFSFEEALLAAGIPVRHIEQGCNVPMFKTSIATKKAGPFEGPMVCSMRPMTPEQARRAYEITAAMPNVHGAPVQIGHPEAIGVADVMKPDYGDPVEIREGEIPVFWPCGVTPQAAVENAKPPISLPGHTAAPRQQKTRCRILHRVFVCRSSCVTSKPLGLPGPPAGTGPAKSPPGA